MAVTSGSRSESPGRSNEATPKDCSTLLSCTIAIASGVLQQTYSLKKKAQSRRKSSSDFAFGYTTTSSILQQAIHTAKEETRKNAYAQSHKSRRRVVCKRKNTISHATLEETRKVQILCLSEEPKNIDFRASYKTTLVATHMKRRKEWGERRRGDTYKGQCAGARVRTSRCPCHVDSMLLCASSRFFFTHFARWSQQASKQLSLWRNEHEQYYLKGTTVYLHWWPRQDWITIHKEAKNHLLGLGFEARETESYTAIIISRISRSGGLQKFHVANFQSFHNPSRWWQCMKRFLLHDHSLDFSLSHFDQEFCKSFWSIFLGFLLWTYVSAFIWISLSIINCSMHQK